MKYYFRGTLKRLDENIRRNPIKNSVIPATNTYIHPFESHFSGNRNISLKANNMMGPGVKPHTNHNVIAVSNKCIIF